MGWAGAGSSGSRTATTQARVFIWHHLEPWPLAAKCQKAMSIGGAGVVRGQGKGEGTLGREKTRRLSWDAPTASTSLQPAEETPRDTGVHSRPATDVDSNGHCQQHVPHSRCCAIGGRHQRNRNRGCMRPGAAHLPFLGSRGVSRGPAPEDTMARHHELLWKRNGSERRA